MDLTTTGSAAAIPRQLAYWEQQAASVNGMLGGFEVVSPADAASSQAFIDKLTPREGRAERRVLDVGAGIGRVTKFTLLPAGFGRVDLLEASARFLEQAVAYVDHPGLGARHCSTMTDFAFGDQTWHLVWVQWVAIYLDDNAFVEFFRRCGAALVPEPTSFGPAGGHGPGSGDRHGGPPSPARSATSPPTHAH
jgi:protein N-terminal methyltransferase